jgi:pimeloyl-ACP methyl ester carboxylesterase
MAGGSMSGFEVDRRRFLKLGGAAAAGGALGAGGLCTLIVHGDRDLLFPLELPVEMYRSIPNSSLWILPGHGHESLLQSELWTARLRETALEFLGGS